MAENTVTIICENVGEEVHVAMGTSLQDLINILSLKSENPFLAAYINNSLRELNYKIYEPISIRFIDITHFEGMRVYQRTLFFTLSKAVHDLYPDKQLIIRHSVSKGFYCEIDKRPDITVEEITALKNRMNELIAQNIPIVRRRVLSTQAEAIYERLGYEDKLALLHSRPRLYSTLYYLADMAGYMFGALAPSTGYIHKFDLRKYYQGIYIAVPRSDNPKELNTIVHQEKMFDVFNEYKDWVSIMGVSNIGSLNQKIIQGKSSELIKVAEAFHEKKLGNIADMIDKANEEREVKLVLIAGPSSSGKTTFAKRLGIQLRILGMTPVMISLDDYFVNREDTPLDEDGEYDYESIDALDLETFNDNLTTLFKGGAADIPRYDFITGKREYHEEPLKLDERSILIVEGIHGLNPKLTNKVDNKYIFKIYISALTSISLDNMSRIATTDNRLLRRIVRDYEGRGATALDTIRRWPSVRSGEDQYIFPYQENAQVMFNSSLFYEISVLRRFIEPMLLEVPNTEPEYGEARRLLKFLESFIPIEPNEIPPTSLLREFIGGSSFEY